MRKTRIQQQAAESETPPALIYGAQSIAKRFDVAVQTVRAWAIAGKIQPDFIDPTNGRAYYSAEQIERLAQERQAISA